MQASADNRIEIPQRVRECLALAPDTEVDFVEEQGRFYLVKLTLKPRAKSKFQRLRGIATVKMITDDVMTFTRGEM